MESNDVIHSQRNVECNTYRFCQQAADGRAFLNKHHFESVSAARSPSVCHLTELPKELLQPINENVVVHLSEEQTAEVRDGCEIILVVGDPEIVEQVQNYALLTNIRLQLTKW